MYKYLITSSDISKSDKDFFRLTLYKQLKKYKPHYVLYRDKSNTNYALDAVDFIEVCSEFKNIKNFLHQNADLAKELGATGVHLTSKQFDKISYAKQLGLEVVISTHTHEEVLLAQKLGADALTYSPIFYSQNKGEPKGIEDLKTVVEKSNTNIFALGGVVTQEHVDMIAKTGAYGFASIRYFS